MKALMVLQTDFPPDIRLEKEIGALNAAGIEVSLLCRYQADRAPDFDIEVEILPMVKGRQMLNRLLTIPLFFNPFWLVKILGVIKKQNIDLLHVHDLPLAPLVIFIARLLGKPVVYDMHEHYPAMLRETTKGKSPLKYYVTRNAWMAERLDNWSIRRANTLLYTASEFTELLADKVSPDQTCVLVSNTEEIPALHQSEVAGKTHQPIRLCFVGGYGRSRPLIPLVKAIHSLRGQVAFHLEIVGKGSDEDRIREIIRLNELENQVSLIPWVPLESVWERIQAADLCLLPQIKNEHSDHVLPHKIFQYLKYAKPVLAGNCRPLMRIVNGGDCGFVADFLKMEELQEALLRIADANLPQLGRNGYEHIAELYSWDKDAKRLVKAYRDLVR